MFRLFSLRIIRFQIPFLKKNKLNLLDRFFLCRSFYNVKALESSKKFTTPYGARLEWDLESPPEEQNIKIEKSLAVPCRLILHLKDKFLIRNKKRWSQVGASKISLIVSF